MPRPPDQTESKLTDLRRDVDDLDARLLRLQTQFEQFVGKFGTGSKYLRDIQYRSLYDGTATVAAGTLAISPVIDTLPGTLHAVYVVSAHAPDSNTPVLITDGSVVDGNAVVAPSGSISVALQRQRQTSPTRTEVSIMLYNAGASDQVVAVKVWRILGLGS